MFIQLEPYKDVKKTKHFSFMLGMFLMLGGGFSICRELILKDQANILFVYAAIIHLLAGVIITAYAKDRLPFKESYFSMNKERISFRLMFYGKEHILQWNSIKEIKITNNIVLFELKSGSNIILRLSAIQQPETARHIKSSIRLAALDQHVVVNGVISLEQRA
jgi:hypothetical protein